MFLAYKYAARKYRERKAEKDAAPAGNEEQGEAATQAGTSANANAQSLATDVEPENGSQIPIETSNRSKKNKKKDPSPEELAEKKRRSRYRWKIILGLTGPFALQSLDTTIIASALPYIATDFDEVTQLNWIISSFNLTSAAFLPFWAQMCDIFGRHASIQTAIIVMAVGSAICTGAPTSSFGVLLFGRALQGIGAAGTNICIRTILADRVSLSEYSLNWTIFILVSGVAFSVGPVVGGYLTQASWRWCFAINLPVAVVSIIAVLILLRKELLGPQPLQELEERDTSTRHGRLFARLSTIDYGGQLLFLWGLGLLILALTWGGGAYAWNSATVTAPLVIGGVLSAAWICYEYAMAPGRLLSKVFPLQRPMMPWEVLSQRNIGLLFLINLSVGMALFAVLYFMDLYFALVEGRSAGDAGAALLYFLPGSGVGAYMAMFSSNVWPRQTLPPIIFGNITAAVGVTVLAWAIHAEKTILTYGMMALVGHGVMIRMNPGSSHALAYFPTTTAAVTGLTSFSVPFGGLLGLTIMSTVFINKSGEGQQNARDGIMWAFIAMIPFLWLSLILSTFLGNVWILKDGGHEVVEGSYIWSLITFQKIERKRVIRGDGPRNTVPPNNDLKEGEDVESGVKRDARISEKSVQGEPQKLEER